MKIYKVALGLIVLLYCFSYGAESPFEFRSITIAGPDGIQTLSPLDGEFGFNVGCSPYSPLIDIVWCVDNTGSMGGVINQVKNSMHAFIDSLARTGMNYALGLVEFWDNVVFPFGTNLTTSAATFQSWINTMGAYGGGDTPEVSLDAIADAIRQMRWRPGARRVIIMITDAPYHYAGDGSGFSDETMGSVISLATANGVTVFVLVPTSLFGTYSPLTSATGGRYYDIYGNYNVIFADIVSGLHSIIATGMIFNNSGRVLNPVYAQIVLGPCLTLLSGSNPQNLGQLNPGSGASPSWQFDVGACSGCNGCFWIVAWSGSIRDSVRGCVQYDNCQCTPPSFDYGMPSPCGAITACEYQTITVRIADSDPGVNPSSIRLRVNGVNYRYPDFTYSAPYLSFTPTTGFHHLQRVEYSVDYAADLCWCEQRTPLNCYFIMDMQPPIITSWTPAIAGSIVPPDSILRITITVVDTPAGIDAGNAYFTVNGRTVSGINYSGGIYSGTFTQSIDLRSLGITSGDTVRLCFHRQDLVLPTYCGPNQADSCIVFYTNVGPVARIVQPRPDSITACSDQPIIIYIVDNNGIDPSSIVLEINGEIYRVGSGYLSFRQDSVLIFQPPIGYWHNNQDVHVRLLQARDIYGADMQNPPLDWHFYVDLQPPVRLTFWPPQDTIFFVNPESITVTIIDSLSGLDFRSVDMLINWRSVPYNTRINSDSSITLTFRVIDPLCPPRSAGICPITVCIPGMDTPDYCAPNDTTICWNFTIVINGPHGRIVRPRPDSITACDDQPIIVVIRDTLTPIDSNSIEITVNGIHYTVAHQYLSFQEDSLLIFQPHHGYYYDGETVHVAVINAANINGTRMDNLPLEWDFYVDLTPPVFWDSLPRADSSVADTFPMIGINVLDSISGLDYSSIRLTVRSTSDSGSFTLLSPALGYAPPQLLLNTEAAGLHFHDNDTVWVCIDSAWDTPDYCDPNISDPFCWRFFVNYIGPVVRIIEPLPNTYSACDDQGIFVYIYDASGVDESTIDFVINGIHYRVGDTYVTYRNDTLRFTPPPYYWRNGEVVYVSVDSVRDRWGIISPDVPLSWRFTIDLHPPDIWNFYPAPNAIVANDRPDIQFNLVDSLSGLDSSRAVFIIEDTIRLHLGERGVHYTNGRVTISCNELGITFADLETVRVCLDSLRDTPDYCAPNETTYCWHFVVSLAGPRARIIQYRPNTFVACVYPDQWISIAIFDEDGVDPNSIRLTVEGIQYRIPNPQIDFRHDIGYRNDTLIFRPPVSWLNAQVVDVCLDSAADVLGNPMSSPLCWSFTMDLRPPFIYSPYPLPGSIVTDSVVNIRFFLNDSLSGVDVSSLVVTINGVTYSDTGITGLHLRGARGDTGYVVGFNPVEAHTYFHDFDTVEVCAHVLDRPDYCGPNILDTCFTFEVRLRGPVPDTLVPWARAITSCNDQLISILLTDDDFGVNWNTAVIMINESTYNYSHGGLYHIGDTLYFDPDSFGVRFNNEDTVRVRVTYADDNIGNHLQWILDYRFLVDTEHPIVSLARPGGGDTISTTHPIVRFLLTDNLSGVDTSSIVVRINGTPYPISDSAVWISMDTVYFSSAIAGLRFSGGDSVRVCVYAFDSPDLCEPNVLDTCWTFYIVPGGPYPELVRPFNGAYSACEAESIVATLIDEEGVVPGSIIYEVIRRNAFGEPGRIDTTRIAGVPNLGLTYDGTTLVYHPLRPFVDAESVYVCVVYSEDPIGNPQEPSPYCWQFIMDRSAPLFHILVGLPDTVYRTRTPEIIFELRDLLSGLDARSVRFTVNGRVFGIDSAGVTFAGGAFRWSASSAGMRFCGGDTIHLCLYAHDRPDYCAPNQLDTCWNVTIEPGGPHAEIVRPFDGAFSSCNPESIIIHLWDSTGVDPSTIRLVVNGDTLMIGTPGLTYTGDRLVYVPMPNFGDSEAVHVQLVRADDILCNPLETPLDWRFQMDRIPPEMVIIRPMPGETVSTRSPEIIIRVRDNLSGLNNANIRINGMSFDTLSPALNFYGDTLVFSSRIAGLTFSGGDSVQFCLRAWDSPDYCSPNFRDSCFVFYITPGGPIAHIDTCTYRACPDQNVIIYITDEDGVVDSTILVSVVRLHNGVRDSTNLRYNSPGVVWDGTNGIFTYNPISSFADRESIYIYLLSASDTLGNPLVRRYNWFFIMDLSAPVVISHTPSTAETVLTTSPTICFTIADSLSGINPAGIDVRLYDHNNRLHHFRPSDPGVALTRVSPFGYRICIDSTLTGGMGWIGGDSITACISAYDSPCMCEPNTLDYCFYFVIPSNYPVASFCDTTTCRYDTIAIRLTARYGIDPSTIRFWVDGVLYTTDSTRLYYRNNYLYFIPPDTNWFLAHEGTPVPIWLERADDYLGNPLDTIGHLNRWNLLIDLTPPYIANEQPANGDTIINYITAHHWQDPVRFNIGDSLLPVNTRTLTVSIDSFYWSDLLGTPGRVSRTLHCGDPGLSCAGGEVILDPRSVSGITYFEDTLSGAYFAEFDWVNIMVIAEDIPPCPDGCGPNVLQQSWRFYIADDDTTPPSFTDAQPAFAGEFNNINVRITISDSSGIFDDNSGPAGQGIYLEWHDNHGESGIITMHIDSTIDIYSFIATTDIPIPPQFYGDTLYITIHAYDNDYDFLNARDRREGTYSFVIPILRGPEAEPVQYRGYVGWCDPQGEIIVRLYDLEGVNHDSIWLNINGRTYTTRDPNLRYANDTLRFYYDPSGFTDGEIVTVKVFAKDINNLPMRDTLVWNFTIDYRPPVYSVTYPNVWMIREESPQIVVHIHDDLAGVDPLSLRMTVNGVEYGPASFNFTGTGERNRDGDIIFRPANVGVKFQPGDTVYVRVRACDNPDYCGSNCSDTTFSFMIEPRVACLVHPNPFTPNADGYNDIAVFNYPYMFSTDAELYIFNKWNVEVYKGKLGHISDFADFVSRCWDGRDKDGKVVPPGVYLYVIKVNGEVICNGTVVVAR